MVNYEVRITKSAEKELKKLDSSAVLKIVAAMKSLEFDPFPYGCRKLASYEDIYRYRIGRYRIIYEVQDKKLIVRVIKIGHRKDVYRSF